MDDHDQDEGKGALEEDPVSGAWRDRIAPRMWDDYQLHSQQNNQNDDLRVTVVTEFKITLGFFLCVSACGDRVTWMSNMVVNPRSELAEFKDSWNGRGTR